MYGGGTADTDHDSERLVPPVSGCLVGQVLVVEREQWQGIDEKHQGDL